MEEQLDDVLATCIALFARLQYSNEELEKPDVHIGHFTVTCEGGQPEHKVAVGAGRSRSADENTYTQGTGETIGAAARDWRERMVAEAGRRIAHHHELAAFLQSKGLQR